MKVATKEQMNKLDEETIALYGVPGILLMERAAYKVYEHIMTTAYNKIMIFCGSGNNGGDGFALARQLFMWGHREVEVVFVGKEEKLTPDAKVYYNLCKKLEIPTVHYAEKKEAICRRATLTDIVVDALFGTGLSKEVVGDYLEAIQCINKVEKAYKISIDIPSGIACDSGRVLGDAVRADYTITFELTKLGLCLYPGIMYAGKVEVVPIGIPDKLKEALITPIECMDEQLWRAYLPKRHFRSNKGTYGKALMIGGSKGMAGAITLAAKACMKVGCGLVSVAVPDVIYPIVESSLWEAMTIGCNHDGKSFTQDVGSELANQIAKSTVIGVGPGIGRSQAIEGLVQSILLTNKPCVIDADGLYALKSQLEQLKNRQAPTILTPHPGEMSYLTDRSIEEILRNSLEISWEFAKAYDVIIVLKMERTLIATKDRVYINTTGNSGLAKGGSGDVLTGMITGFLAQGVPADQAAALGVYGHGKAADLIAGEKGMHSLLPSDLYQGMEKLFIQ